MTLDEIKQACAEEAAPPDPDPPTNDQSRDWWVLVVNPRRQPPEPKFYASHDTQHRAEQTAADQQAKADEQAQQETHMQGREWKPYRYFVIRRPEEGAL